MRWEFIALFSAGIVGIFNTLLEGNGKAFKSDYLAKLTHMMMIIVFSGIIALFVIVYIYHTHKPSLNKAVSFSTNETLRIILPGLMIPLYLFLNMKALSEGGGIAMAIINLNIIVSLIGGHFVYNDKTDTTLVITVLSIIALTGFASYHNYQLNR
jgi:hypothetical protein